MTSKTKLIIIAAFAFAVLIAAIAVFLSRPIKNVIELVGENKDKISEGLTLIELDDEITEAIEKKAVTGLDVLHYSIKIDLFPDKKIIKGDVTATIYLGGNDLQKISLDFYDNMIIENVFIDDKNAMYERDEKTLSVFRREKNSDTVKIRIKYKGTPKNLGFGSFNFVERGNKHYIYTMNEPVYASTWLPCVDIPTDKFNMDMFISSDSSMVSLSNGRLINIETNGKRRTYHWKTYYPISTYLIAIYSADYKTYSQKYISVAGDTIDLYCYATPEKFEDLKKDFSDHQSYFKIFEDMFGAYPFPDEKYGLAEFWWNYGAMESQTITGVGDKYISGRKFFMDMLIHELAHHWWGNAVTPKTWKDIWLNEGFATYSEALYWEKRSGFSSLQSTLDSKFDTFENGTLYNPVDNLFSRLMYDKGAWVLHMLRREIGDEKFFATLRQYLEMYKYKNASTEDFKNLAEKISGKSLKQFFEQWIYKGEGIIEIEYEWKYEKNNNGYKTIIELNQLQNGYDIYKFPLDIKISFDNEVQIITREVKSRNEKIVLSLKSKPNKIEMDPDKWLLAVFNGEEKK